MKKVLLASMIFVFVLSSFSQETGTFKDIRDGKVYKTVKIGTQTWLAENLAYNMSSGCYIYDNKHSNLATYGCLYTWEAAKKACPAGWHAPTDAEWQTLIDYIGGEGIAGGKLKVAEVWSSPNTDANDGSGFSALPGGSRDSKDGYFVDLGNIGKWWSATELNAATAWYRCLYNNTAKVSRNNIDKASGLSLRCIKD